MQEQIRKCVVNCALVLTSVAVIAAVSDLKRSEQIIRPPEPAVMETAAPEEIVTGVCTFGDCPAGTTEKSSAVAEETTIPDAATEAVKESLTTPSQVTANFQLLTEPEQEDPETERL